MSWKGMRVRMARRVLCDLAQSATGIAPILLGVLGPLLVAAVAVLVLPLFYAATLSWPMAAGAITLQTAAGGLPVVLLRAQLLPTSLMRWAQSQPVSAATQWSGDAAAVGTCLAPLALAYAVSSLVWVVQSPRWLQGLWAQELGLVVLSWLASSAIGLAALRLRWHVLQATWLVLTAAFSVRLHQGSMPAAYMVVFSLAMVAWSIWRAGVARQCLYRLRQALVVYPVSMGGLKHATRVWVVLPTAVTAIGLWVLRGLSQRPTPSQAAYAACLLLGACALAWAPTHHARERRAVVVAWLVGLILFGAQK